MVGSAASLAANVAVAQPTAAVRVIAVLPSLRSSALRAADASGSPHAWPSKAHRTCRTSR